MIHDLFSQGSFQRLVYCITVYPHHEHNIRDPPDKRYSACRNNFYWWSCTYLTVHQVDLGWKNRRNLRIKSWILPGKFHGRFTWKSSLWKGKSSSKPQYLGSMLICQGVPGKASFTYLNFSSFDPWQESTDSGKCKAYVSDEKRDANALPLKNAIYYPRLSMGVTRCQEATPWCLESWGPADFFWHRI